MTKEMIEAGAQVLQRWLSEPRHEMTIRELIVEIYLAMRAADGDDGVSRK